MEIKVSKKEGIAKLVDPSDERKLDAEFWTCPICGTNYVLAPNDEIPPCSVCGNQFKTLEKPREYILDF